MLSFFDVSLSSDVALHGYDYDVVAMSSLRCKRLLFLNPECVTSTDVSPDVQGEKRVRSMQQSGCLTPLLVVYLPSWSLPVDVSANVLSRGQIAVVAYQMSAVSVDDLLDVEVWLDDWLPKPACCRCP